MLYYTISLSKRKCLYALLLIGLAPACAVATSPNKDIIYQRELPFSVNGQAAKGVFVAPRQPVYKMTFSFPESPAVVKLTSCHREETFRYPGKTLTYEYRPQRFLEDQGSCLFEVASFSLSGFNLAGIVDFEGEDKLLANVGCNGNSLIAKGVSLCQARAGLSQVITFQKPVTASSSDDTCPKVTTADKLNFYYEIAANKCLYFFTDGTNSHRLTTIGYQEVLLK